MDSAAIFALSPPTFLTPKPSKTTIKTLPVSPWKHRISQPSHLHCHKMFVPGFGEAPPEAKAANNLHNFFTYIAVKIVAAQLESYNPEAHKDLMEFLARHSLNDGDEFCASLMRESSKHKSLGRLIWHTGADFEWDNLKRLAVKRVNESNTKLMRDYVLETSHVE
ncbi:hypothetical protein Cgig2_011261 [Carnegiea gigantea]|uniref:Chaperonin-like RBCX protein 1, chloroplastic n=1 Tax=Carnegiea gigantea TaxID=171969 RepID=A0A9Q1KGC6_9CARY|nr:hypothetical protein Cgig2_011261 [Carnegiea gigantea]